MLAVALTLDVPLLDSGSSTVAQPRLPLFELLVLYLPFGKNLDHAVHLTVTEIALALGLLFATPVDLMLAGVGTPVLIDLIRRRKGFLKQVFNGASRALGIGIALTVYQALDPSEPLSDVGWMALCLAVTASGLASALAGALVISLAIGRLPARDLVSHMLWAITIALEGATVSFVAGLALQVGASAVAPLLVSLAALLVMMRGFSLLTERHMNLASLHSLGQRLASARDVDAILTTALDTSAHLLVARDAEVYLRSPHDSSRLLRVRKDPEGALVTTQVGRDSLPDTRGVLADKSTVVASAPLGLGHEVVLSVKGRAGPMRPFGQVDARLLDMVAHQTGANLHTAELIEQLRHDALHDPLTELPNRRSLLETAQEHLTRRHPIELVWLGIRDLQAVNAALGYDRGDELLIQIGRRLQEAAGPEAVVARVGGDEFAILLPADADGSTALLATLAQPFLLSHAQVLVRACVGVTLGQGGSVATAEDLLRRADIAMRVSHRTGRAVEHYTPALETATSDRLALAVDLRMGIARGELVLHAQPQVSLVDNTVTGMEMLVRWNHPRLGLLRPDAFVPLAEQTGLDRPMTAWVLNAALQALAGWRAEGLELTVSVNVSPGALCDGTLRDRTEDLLAQHALAGEDLV